MGMSSPSRKISIDSSSALEVMDIRKMVAVEEKYITRSYFKDDKSFDTNILSQKTYSKNKLGKELAEVFRTDFITAMKVPDSQQLAPEECLTLTDTWRQEWEKGVQVPVNTENAQKSAVCRKVNFDFPVCESFNLPEARLTFNQEEYNMLIDRSSTLCNYDLDEQDAEWLNTVTSLRTLKKATTIDELTMERAITWFERECFEKMAHAVATKEGLSIEYDESTTCNVCLSPDAEDGNEIIFCDACMMCAHQHCYGVLEIPEGTWLCNPCSRGILAPPCCLCPNKGGAMKRIKDSLDWIHVICAWWVPEVQIEDVKYIERISTNKIPPSRWNLSCNICREKMGACIQCTMKRCVRAYHVTCAVEEGLEMKTVVVPEKNDVQHISFCSKHCTPVPQEKNINLVKSEDFENNRIKELRKLESEFYTLVSVKKASQELKLCREVTRRLLSYWTIKRRANENVPLIKLTLEQQEKLSGKQGVVFIAQQRTLEMERFLHLRQDLERLRNLCYMIVRREKMRKELHRMSVDVFYKQNDILLDRNEDLSGKNLDFIQQRSTRFNRFSENYRTEHDYKMEHGIQLTMFDTTFEDDDDDMLNSSQLEKMNLEELERVAKQAKKNENKIENSKIAVQYNSKNIEGKSLLKIKSKSAVIERNIFDLLTPEDKPLSETLCFASTKINRTSSPVQERYFNQPIIDSDQKSEDFIKTYGVMCTKDKTKTTKACNEKDIHDEAPPLNRFYHDEDDDGGGGGGGDGNKKDFCSSNETPPTSRLVKKGKKRFRNLHKFDREGCRNSPRLHIINNEEETCNSDAKTHQLIDPNKLSKIISEAKRRRLNSSGDYATEYEEEPPDYVRVTRSRVASCS